MMPLVKDKLITDNVKLVYYVYNRLGKSPLIERNKDDLIAEGMLGLCQAANTFNESRGTKFCTYATLCIRNAMLMYLRKLRKYMENVHEDDFDADSVVDEIAEPKTKRGDLWTLGNHRLLCGDCTQKEDIAKVLDDSNEKHLFFSEV